jgi:Tol biopolymer transport system component
MRRLTSAVLFGAVAAGIVAVTISAQALHVALPEGHEFTNPDRQVFALSPDGTRLVYIAKATLFVKGISDAQPVSIPGPLAGRGKSNPVFSPDGQSVLYWAQDGAVLERVPVTGGTPVTIAKADQPFGMSWAADDQILVGQGAKGIMRVSAKGGNPQTIVTMKAGELAHGPQMLPGGDAVLFTLGKESAKWDEAQIVVQSLKSGERKTVIPAGRDARYLSSGHLVYALGGRIRAVQFDVKSLASTGQTLSVADGVQMAGATGTAQFSVSASGSLAYVSASVVPVQLGLVGLDGTRKMLGEVPQGTSAPRVSPNSQQVTFAAGGDIYVAELSNLAGARRVISNGTFPLFSPDGQWLAFGSLGTKRDGGMEELFMQRADGSGQAELLVKPGRAPESWPAGDLGFSFISHRGTANNYDLWTYSVKDKEVTPMAVVDVSAQLSSQFSPDLHWFAYMSSEVGDWQVFVQPVPNPMAVKYQLTKQGGRFPMWSADGRQLFYENDGRMFSAPFQAGAQPTIGKPVELAVRGFIQPLIRRNYDMMPDRKSFLMLFRPGPQIEVVSNWTAQLKQLALAN